MDNSNTDNFLLERATPLKMKTKKAFRNGHNTDDEERRKKYLGDLTKFPRWTRSSRSLASTRTTLTIKMILIHEHLKVN